MELYVSINTTQALRKLWKYQEIQNTTGDASQVDNDEICYEALSGCKFKLSPRDGLPLPPPTKVSPSRLTNYNIHSVTKISPTSWMIIRNMSGCPNQGIKYKATKSDNSIPMFTAERFYNIPGNKVACPYRVFQIANKFFLQMDRKSIIAENPLFDLEGIRTFHVGVFAMQLEKREPRIKSFSKKL